MTALFAHRRSDEDGFETSHTAHPVGSDPMRLVHTADVAGVPIAVTSTEDAVSWLIGWIRDRRGGIGVRLVNAYSIVSAYDDPRYLALMRRTGVSLPDGAPVAVALRLLAGKRHAGRVRGPSFFVRTLERADHERGRHFFLGTTDSTLDSLESVIAERMPGLPVAGVYAPPFGQPDDDFLQDCVARVRASGADCVWVALGTPKQDFVAERLAAQLGVPCIAVGAAFDFLAGTKREAPRVLQAIGAEWIYRFATEPRRLWRRYLVGNVRFLILLAARRRPVVRAT